MKFTLPSSPGMILKAMSADGFSCYLVGGCVRDMLQGEEPADYDFVTDRNPQEIKAAAAKEGWKVWEHGVAFGVVNVLSQDSSYEIATMRTESYGADPHRPTAVKYVDDIVQDLSRRDFSINAMALDGQGRIIDPFGGQDDLKNRIIRCVGCPRDRFLEDPLRVLRAARFISKMDFRAEPGLASAARDEKVLRRLTKLSVERVRDELGKILLASHASRGLRFLVETGILKHCCCSKTEGGTAPVPILPEVVALQGVMQNPRFHAYDVLEHTFRTVDGITPDPVLRWAALLHDVSKGKEGIRCLNKSGDITDYGHAGAGAVLAREILGRLRFPAVTAERIVWLVKNHMIFPGIDDSYMTKWVKKRSHFFPQRESFIEAAEQLFLLADADNRARGKEIDESYIHRVKAIFQRVMSQSALYPAELDINGNYIAKIFGRGPQVGKILQDLLIDVQTGRLPNTNAALKAAVIKKAKRRQK